MLTFGVVGTTGVTDPGAVEPGVVEVGAVEVGVVEIEVDVGVAVLAGALEAWPPLEPPLPPQPETRPATTVASASPEHDEFMRLSWACMANPYSTPEKCTERATDGAADGRE